MYHINNNNTWIKFLLICFFFFPMISLLIFLYNDWSCKEFNLVLIIIKCFIINLIISITVINIYILFDVIIKKILLRYNYIPILVTFFLLGLLIWFIFINKHFPRDLNQTFDFGIQIIIVVGIMIYFLLLTIFYFIFIITKIKDESKLFALYLFEKNKELEKNSIYLYISSSILNVRRNTLYFFFDLFGFKTFLDITEFLLIKLFLGKEKYYYMFFWFLKITIVLLLLIEIVFYKEIIYFYKLAFLLLVPIIFNLILDITKYDWAQKADFFLACPDMFILKNDVENNKFITDNQEEYKDFKIICIENLIIMYRKNFFDNSNYTVIDYIIMQINCDKINAYYENYTQNKIKYDKFFYFFYYLVFFIIFLYFSLILLNLY